MDKDARVFVCMCMYSGMYGRGVTLVYILRNDVWVCMCTDT